MNVDTIWLAEYSPQQGAFHVETAREAMEQNLRQIVASRMNSFLPFAVCGSRAAASRACNALAEVMERHGGRPTMASREEAAYRRGVLETLNELTKYLDSAELREVHEFASRRARQVALGRGPNFSRDCR